MRFRSLLASCLATASRALEVMARRYDNVTCHNAVAQRPDARCVAPREVAESQPPTAVYAPSPEADRLIRELHFRTALSTVLRRYSPTEPPARC